MKFLLLLLIPSFLLAGWFGPSSYDECLIKEASKFDKMPRGMGTIIKRKCRIDFPIKKTKYIPKPKQR